MEHEKVLIMDDNDVTRGLLVEFIQSDGRHDVVGESNSIEKTKELIKQGVKPTVAILDNSCRGKDAAEIIRKSNPDVVIASYSASDDITWGDVNWCKKEGLIKLPQKLTDLQH